MLKAFFELLEKPVGFLEKFGGNPGILLLVIGVLFLFVAWMFIDIPANRVIGFAVATAPIWLPIVTFLLFFEWWMNYVKLKFKINQGRTTLEIRLPQDVFKSPEAMEQVLIQLHQTAAPDNHFQTYLDGKHPPTYGLEVVSRGGDIRFYMSLPRKKFKNIAEAQLYSQYPGLEIKELPIDYTAEIPWDPDRFQYFSIHFGPKKPDAYPIKTYIDYGLHNTQTKEEQKIDPITAFIDALASIGPGEYFWVQILIDANRKVSFKEGSLEAKPDWTDAARKEIVTIMENAAKRVGGAEGANKVLSLTETEKQTISAIERSMGKNAFNTAIRGMYIARTEAYNPGERIGALITAFRGYDDVNRNQIGVRWRTDFDWNEWQDPSGKKKQEMKKKELKYYKLRSYEPENPGTDDKKVMTTEELATMFHLPGRVAITPTISRVPSKRGEAPSNLPT